MIHSLVLHILIAALSLFLFVVFLRWWVKHGDATKIYKINCFLMLGLFITHSLAMTKYILVMYFDQELHEVYTWYFSMQQYFLVIPLCYYVGHVIRKLRENKQYPLVDRRKQNA